MTTITGTNPLTPSEASERQRRRNAASVRVSRIENGFIVSNGDTGKTYFYDDIIDREDRLHEFQSRESYLQQDGHPLDIVDHLLKFFEE